MRAYLRDRVNLSQFYKGGNYNYEEKNFLNYDEYFDWLRKYYADQGDSDEETEKEILKIITEDEHIHDPHNLKTRRLGNRIAIEIHIRLDAKMSVEDSHDITVHIENRLEDKFGPETWIMIHVEPYYEKEGE